MFHFLHFYFSIRRCYRLINNQVGSGEKEERQLRRYSRGSLTISTPFCIFVLLVARSTLQADVALNVVFVGGIPTGSARFRFWFVFFYHRVTVVQSFHVLVLCVLERMRPTKIFACGVPGCFLRVLDELICHPWGLLSFPPTLSTN